jgi:hypothetical protein
LNFSNTDDYGTYQTLTYPVTLNAGMHDLSLSFVTAQGSSVYINLDYITLGRQSSTAGCANNSTVVVHNACGQIMASVAAF